MHIKNNQSGFTITELLVSITAGTLVALTVLSVTLFFVADVMASSAKAQLIVDAQNINRRVVEDLRTSTRILDETNLMGVDANEPAGGWRTSNSDVVLVLSQPAVDEDGDFIFDDATGEPFQNELLLFAEDTTLFKRTIANPSAPGNVTLTTCPEELASAMCPADVRFTDRFSAMTFEFFDQNNNLTAIPTEGRLIDVQIEMSTQAFGRDVEATNSIKMTLRNPT